MALLSGAGVANAARASVTPSNAGPPAGSQIAAGSRALSPSDSQPSPGPVSGMQGYGPGGHVLPLHGQIVLAKQGGGFQTVDFQSGTVTKVAAGSITVKSTDGFTQSYAITGSTIVSADRNGIGSVKAGNDAVVIAAVSGHTATAAKIIDLTQLLHSHQKFWLGPEAQP